MPLAQFTNSKKTTTKQRKFFLCFKAFGLLITNHRNWFEKILDQRRTLTSWPDEAFSRTQFHLAKVLLAQDRPEDIETANELHEAALATLHRLLPMDSPPELDGVTDETILFDHLMPISPGGPRFTGRGLLERFMHEQ